MMGRLGVPPAGEAAGAGSRARETIAAATSARSACAARVTENASPKAEGPVRAPSSAKKIVPMVATPSAFPSCWAVTSVPDAAPAAAAGTVRSTRLIRVGTASPSPAPTGARAAISGTETDPPEPLTAASVASRPRAATPAPICGR